MRAAGGSWNHPRAGGGSLHGSLLRLIYGMGTPSCTCPVPSSGRGRQMRATKANSIVILLRLFGKLHRTCKKRCTFSILFVKRAKARKNKIHLLPNHTKSHLKGGNYGVHLQIHRIFFLNHDVMTGAALERLGLGRIALALCWRRRVHTIAPGQRTHLSHGLLAGRVVPASASTARMVSFFVPAAGGAAVAAVSCTQRRLPSSVTPCVRGR